MPLNQAIPPSSIPAPRGLEREEPELAHEDDIPTNDNRWQDEDIAE